MGSTEDQHPNPYTLPDPSSIQPLLSKPYPPSLTQEPIALPSDPDPDQSNYLQISYHSGPRPVKDLPFLILFALFVLSTFAFGIFASVSRNPDSSSVSSYVYDSNSTSCVLDSSLSTNHPSLNSTLSSSLIWTLVITLIISVPFVLSVLLLLKHFTKQVVYISLPLFIIVPILINVYWFVACTVDSSCSDLFPLVYRILVLVFVFLVIGVVVWIVVVNWHRVELTVNIIGVASHALWRNLGLFGVLPALTLGLVVYYVPIVVFLVFANENGEIVVRYKSEEYYCAWKQDSWVPAYYALGILTMLWSAAAMVEAQVYVTSGTIAQWYFSKDDSGPRRSIRNSLRNAFGPSSGTVCLSGLLICVVRVVRAMVDSARQEGAPGMVKIVLQCCVNTLLSAFDFLNKFTINFAAITGESYCTSARMAYELLKRNLLSAVFVETVSTRLLAGIAFVFSAIYAVVVCAILNSVSDLGADSYFVAAMAWVLLLVVLSYFVHVLDNVIDTVYVCYAIDRDRGEVGKQEVHEVYVHLPINRTHRQSLIPRTPLSA
ncbi:hypothetical protein RHGRI_032922 [Rhododendron griersonianum]|uniref:Choline transporter-like protein n=1 Tax=Rhododendron griersonianum TaxID=479676 RepID=A0AAV6IIH7_9ERIC|nr:hypothetical protein RHGRI_032922 [Rhododendron griersonianum]KAG5526815.1 hypothetical protein RHGRI_032922 [Rhododendron griersonianum]